MYFVKKIPFLKNPNRISEVAGIDITPHSIFSGTDLANQYKVFQRTTVPT